MWSTILPVIITTILIYFIGYTIYAIATGLLSISVVRKFHRNRKTYSDDVYAQYPISIIVPAHNEEVVIKDVVKNLLHLDYPNYEVIVVNDGSTDNTAGELSSFHGDVTIHNKLIREGKAGAFNSALQLAKHPYIVTVDADTVLTKDSLKKLISPVIKNNKVVAVGAQVGVMNGVLSTEGELVKVCPTKGLLKNVQALEYLKTFLIYRTGHNFADATLLISGACGLYRKDVLLRVGGFDTTSVCEDIEITMRIQENIKYNKTDELMEFVPDPVAWTEVPDSFTGINRQRNRWFRGTAQTLWKYKGNTLNPKMGWVGLYSLPFYWLFGWFSPFAQLASLILLVLGAFGVASWNDIMWLVLFGVVASSLINVLALSIIQYTETPVNRFKYKVKLFFVGFYELYVFQFILMAINLIASVQAILGQRHWLKIKRVGFGIKE